MSTSDSDSESESDHGGYPFNSLVPEQDADFEMDAWSGFDEVLDADQPMSKAEMIRQLEEMIAPGQEAELWAIRNETLTDQDRDNIRAFHLKVMSNMSREVYEQLRHAFDHKLDLSSEYVMIHRMAILSGVEPLWFHCCINSCMAYTGDDTDRTTCRFCNEPRFTHVLGKPRRLFCYLPIIPRLQGYFQNPDMAKVLLYRHTYKHEPNTIADVFDAAHYRTLRKQNVVVDGETLAYKYFSGKKFTIVEWDEEHFRNACYDDDHYLKLKLFVEFILVPFVACSLIAQDFLDFNLQDAIFERNNSREFGELVHPEDDMDDEANTIHEQNVMAIRSIQQERERQLKRDRHPDVPQPPSPQPPRPKAPPPTAKLTVPQPPQPTVPPRHRKNPNPNSKQLTILVPPLKTPVEETISIGDFKPPEPKLKKEKPTATKEKAKGRKQEQPAPIAGRSRTTRSSIKASES
ncbi:hypothetical protein B0H12DRAFT_731303 [Mycena haematopus]|nr:hypothetical protein B0H12DRAFT_731303 [Mycena haematopus]